MPNSIAASSFIDIRDVVVRYGSVTAVKGVSFQVQSGEHVTLLGPSGCGKTTTLRSIAGLETPSEGSISIAGSAVYSSSDHINVPVEKRNLSMVFQSYAIWPHMTVSENVAYGLRIRKFDKAETQKRVQAMLSMVRLEAFADRPAALLSGGQQQRVALARSLAFNPKALLLDEPLSNLDAKLRAEMRIELRDLQKRLRVTSIYVTHDLEEALATSDRIVVMREGLIEQEGTPHDIYNRPKTQFVADFIGAANIINGKFENGSESSKNGVFRSESGVALEFLPVRTADLKAKRVISIRTVYPNLTPRSSGKKPDRPNVWPGVVSKAIFLGDSVQYSVDSELATLTLRKPPVDFYYEGSEVWLEIAPEYCIPVE